MSVNRRDPKLPPSLSSVEASLQEAQQALEVIRVDLANAATASAALADVEWPAAIRVIYETLSEAGVAADDLDPSVARRATLRTIAGQAWEHALGPLLSSEQAGQVLAVGSRQGIEQRIKQHKLIAMQAQNRRWQIPTFQFVDDAPVTPLVDAYWTVSESASDWTAASWCVSPHAELDQLSPRDWAAEGRSDEQLAVVAARDAARLAP